METAYDHIQEEVLKTDEKAQPAAGAAQQPPEANLNTELQDAYRTFSTSAWGVRLGGFLGSVRAQGESYYQSARDEASSAGGEALKGFTDLKSTIVSRARGLSLGEDGPAPAAPATPPAPAADGDPSDAAKSASEGATAAETDAEGFVTRFRAEAEKRLKEVQRAEDAADEALLKFGTNVRNFLRDAVSIAPPALDDADDGDPFTDGGGDARGTGGKGDKKGKVLFESKDAEGRRVIHTTRFDAQLHVVHCSLDSFTKDPASPEWEQWRAAFDISAKTDAIAADLERYEELRRAMERLVPERVEYGAFWTRYYFLRMVVESEEQRRKEMLKGAALGNEEEVGWDEDSDDEPSTPKTAEPAAHDATTVTPKPSSGGLTVKPSEPRTSQDQNSNTGSDESYDLVSRAASSTGPGSPRDGKEREKAKESGTASAQKRDESDEEDWE